MTDLEAHHICIPASERGKEEGEDMQLSFEDVTESGIYHSGSHSIGGNIVMWLHLTTREAVICHL